ncbi:MAG: transpeptidase family protein [Prevotella sp.]|nr:transpeptidase family protein [Prevotella sp.]MBR1462100.1 transpeptidase family protein [Prevotella sp.]
MVLLGLLIVGKALYTATVKRDYWVKVANRLKRDSVDVKPVRGNILSCDGRLMASSLPEYKMFMDFQALHDSKTDSLWYEKLDSICEGLHDIFPERSKQAFRDSLEKGHSKMSRNWPVWKKRVSYDTYSEVKSLPIFNMRPFKGGFHSEEYNSRQRPFGSLAQRTVGDMFGAKDTARCGLELSFDSILRGKSGIVQRKKVMNKYLSITERAPIDGADIVTTIDVGMQDLAERALIDELKLINGNVGVAIVMEVQTGDVKAIVNMSKVGDGQYRETQNHAVSDLLEPGSVFKTASIMVALDDGVVDTTYKVETFGGIMDMHGAKMRDHNWHRGGYGLLSLPQTLEYSSNIGVSRIIDEHYGKNPEKYVEGIYRLGLADDLNIPLVGSSPARIRKPKMDKTGKHWANWSKTALAWMSIGYETQVPPISTLTFYNAIANNGRMMRPRFVKQVVKDGEVLMDFPPEVIRPQICKTKTLKEIQTILYHVVSQGLGKKAGSKSFKVAGKTGTAQISKGAGGYKTGQTNYLLSFAGYFPADAPRYSCIVCIQKSGLPASGGGMSGVVFHHIAEGIMAQDLKRNASDARDSLSVLIPDVKNGNMLSADYVLSHLGVNTANWSGNYADGNPIWGKASHDKKNLQMAKLQEYAQDIVPDVEGMGARDAVYMLESRGLRVKIEGRGKVIAQSLPAGHKIKTGEICSLKLH